MNAEEVIEVRQTTDFVPVTNEDAGTVLKSDKEEVLKEMSKDK